MGVAATKRTLVVAKLTGQVVSVTESGDLVTDLKLSEIQSLPRDESVTILCEGHKTCGIYPVDHQEPEMTFIAFEGEDGFLRLSLVGDDASRFLGIREASSVEVKF